MSLDWKNFHDELARRQAKIERLRLALEPFARNADATSLSEALGHVSRDDLHRARDALSERD
jgi:hypothetical protein